MKKQLSERSRKKFIKQVEESLTQAIARYAVHRDGDLIRYHDFTIKKQPDATYTCKQQDSILFESIVNIRIALILCYNRKFRKNNNTETMLLNYNREMGKHKLDLQYYKNSLSKRTGDLEIFYTRIAESQMVIDRISKKLESLSNRL